MTAQGMGSPLGVQDPEARRLFEELQQAIDALARQITTADTADVPVRIVELLSRKMEIANGRLRVYARTIKHEPGEPLGVSSEHLVQDLKLPTAGDTTVEQAAGESQSVTIKTGWAET